MFTIDTHQSPGAGRAARAWIWPLLVAALCCPLTTAARATVFPPFGGPGGGQEEYRCPPGQFLVGLGGRTGEWIDQVYLICSVVGPDFKLQGLNHLPPRGGSGGGPQEGHCGEGQAVRAIDVGLKIRWSNYRIYRDTENPYVGAIVYTCTRLSDGAKAGCNDLVSAASRVLIPHCASDLTRKDDDGRDIVRKFTCPESEYATGLNIKSGSFLDAASLICGKVEHIPPSSPPLKNPFKRPAEALDLKPPAATRAPAPYVAPASPASPGIEPGMDDTTDRPGNDIARIVLPKPLPADCRQLCSDRSDCVAWTYVRPGSSGPSPACLLKGAPTPPPSRDACCVSGTIKPRQADSMPARRPLLLPPGK